MIPFSVDQELIDHIDLDARGKETDIGLIWGAAGMVWKRPWPGGASRHERLGRPTLLEGGGRGAGRRGLRRRTGRPPRPHARQGAADPRDPSSGAE